MKKNYVSSGLRGYLFTIALFAVCLAFVWSQVGRAEMIQAEEGARLARESLYKAVMTCYAIEGSYPPSYEYIKENYGTGIDEDRYKVEYFIFASNIMPDITILEIQ